MPASIQKIGEPFLWIGWVKRQIGATCLQYAEDADDHVKRPLDAKANPIVSADYTKIPQMMGKPVGLGVQLSIAQLPGLAHHRHRVRVSARRAPRTIREEDGPWDQSAAVAFHSQAIAGARRRLAKAERRDGTSGEAAIAFSNVEKCASIDVTVAASKSAQS